MFTSVLYVLTYIWKEFKSEFIENLCGFDISETPFNKIFWVIWVAERYKRNIIERI